MQQPTERLYFDQVNNRVRGRGDARTDYEASRAHGLSGLACAGDLVVVVFVVVARPGQVVSWLALDILGHNTRSQNI